MIGYETQQSYTVLAYLFVVSFFIGTGEMRTTDPTDAGGNRWQEAGRQEETMEENEKDQNPAAILL